MKFLKIKITGFLMAFLFCMTMVPGSFAASKKPINTKIGLNIRIHNATYFNWFTLITTATFISVKINIKGLAGTYTLKVG